MISNSYYDLQKKYEEAFLKNNSVVKKLKFNVSYNQFSFFEKSPKNHFDVSLANDFYFFLDNLLEKKPDILIETLKYASQHIGIPIRILKEITELNIHENTFDFPKERGILLFELHRLIEGVLHDFSNIISFSYLFREGKNIKTLSTIGSSKPVLDKTFFNFLLTDKTLFIRNALAHHNYKFSGFDVIFYNKEEKLQLSLTELTFHFDKILDYCNAIYLAFSSFYCNNNIFFKTNNIILPVEFKIEFLTKIDYHSFEIVKCEENIKNSIKQLKIEIIQNKVSNNELNLSLILLTKDVYELFNEFDELFISLKPDFDLGFALIKFENIKPNTFKIQDEYRNFLKSTEYIFSSKYKKNIMSNFYKILKLNLKIACLDEIESKEKFEVRYFNIYENKKLLTKASIIVKISSSNPTEFLARNFKRIKIKIYFKFLIKNPKFLLHTRFLEIIFVSENLRNRFYIRKGLFSSVIAISQESDYKNFRFVSLINTTSTKLRKGYLFWNNNFSK